MLNLRLTRFRYGDSIRTLHTRYGSLAPLGLSILWQLFLERKHPWEESRLLPVLRELLPEAEQDRGTGHQTGWVRTMFPAEDVRLPLVAFRKGALYYYIEAAALRVDARTEIRATQRRLQTLGGPIARLKPLPKRDTEQQAIATELEEGQRELKRLRHWPRPDDVQLWWHWTMVRAYECLPRTGTKKRVSPQHVTQLCQWLSVPEIGLACTPAAIKEARRCFKGRDWLGSQYPSYLATPHQPMRPSVMDIEHEDDVGPSPDGDEGAIRFTCHLCQMSTTGTFLMLGRHLQEQHQIQQEDVELSEEEHVLREQTTQTVLATWQELT